ncbi:Bacteriophage Gp15 protein, partial [Weissella bombi]
NDENLTNVEKINQCFSLFSLDLHTDNLATKGSIVSNLFDYINATPYGNFDDEDTPTPENEPTGNITDYDFEQDAAAIYASFMTYYHIDLYAQLDKMHWDVFKALFDNLGEKTPISRIRQIRNDDLSNYKDDAQQAGLMAEAQMYYQLDKNKQADSFGKGSASIFDSLLGYAD